MTGTLKRFNTSATTRGKMSIDKLITQSTREVFIFLFYFLRVFILSDQSRIIFHTTSAFFPTVKIFFRACVCLYNINDAINSHGPRIVAICRKLRRICMFFALCRCGKWCKFPFRWVHIIYERTAAKGVENFYRDVFMCMYISRYVHENW